MRKSIAALAALAITATAADRPMGKVTVTWTMPTTNTNGTELTDLAGAKVYYGKASSNYVQLVDIGMTNQVTLTLPMGVYYLTGTAYNAAGLESDFCPEIRKAATPRTGSLVVISKARRPAATRRQP